MDIGEIQKVVRVAPEPFPMPEAVPVEPSPVGVPAEVG